MTGAREAALLEAANLLLDARRTTSPIENLPIELQPETLPEVYFVQDAIAQAFGEIGGWKIGAPTPEAAPFFAPMPLAWMAPSGSTLTGDQWRYRGLEAEIAFLVGEDLPPRAQPYTRDEVLSAMASCHPAVEVLESAFIDPAKVPRFTSFGDLQIHGAFVYGPKYGSPKHGTLKAWAPKSESASLPDWRSIDFSREMVTLAVDGVLRVERTGSNTAGDLLKLLPWLANEGAARTGGLRAGQWITTGSWTGNTLATSDSSVVVNFSSAGCVDLRFE